MTITSEDQGHEAEKEDAAEVGTDITAGVEAEVVREDGQEAEIGGGEAEAVVDQEAEGGRAPGPRIGRGMRGSQRRGSQKRLAMAKKPLRRKLLRMATLRMGLAMSRNGQGPGAVKGRDQSHAIGKGQGLDRAKDPRGLGPEIVGGGPGLETEGDPEAGQGIEKDPGLGITRVRRARGTGMRGRKSRGITTRRRRDTKIRRKKRPRQLTWRYPTLHERGIGNIIKL